MRKKLLFALVGLGLGASAILLHPEARFVAGGALVNCGYCLQDHLHDYNLKRSHELTADEVWQRCCRQNHLASQVRSLFPRTQFHPVIAMVVCMDARLDTSELTGDTRRYYYIVRTAGSVLDVKEEEMLELAVEKGVRVIVFTTHSDCAAEKAALDPEARKKYPKLTNAVDMRVQRFEEFKARPLIAERIRSGELLVQWTGIDTATDHFACAR